jgi:hypothetical protein
MQTSPESPPGANFPTPRLPKREKRRLRHRQLVLHLKGVDYDRLRALRPRFSGDSPPKIARHLMLLALGQVEQQPADTQSVGGAQ